MKFKIIFSAKKLNDISYKKYSKTIEGVNLNDAEHKLKLWANKNGYRGFTVIDRFRFNIRGEEEMIKPEIAVRQADVDRAEHGMSDLYAKLWKLRSDIKGLEPKEY